MNEVEFKSFIKKVPKAEIHIHIEAVIKLASVKKLYEQCNGKAMSDDELNEIFSYNDLNGFIQAFIKVQNLLVSVDDFNLIFDDLKEYLLENGISYCEAFFAPTAFLKKGFKYEDMVKIFKKKIAEIKKETGIVIKLIMDVSRTFGLENAMNNYKLLKEYPCEDIIGIGLGGAESKGAAKDYAPVFKLAESEGYKVVAHAGEDVGPESIWDAINLCHAQRIGHGITAIQDEKLMQQLTKSKLPVEVCITSNTFTKKVVKEAKDHPIREFFDRGMLVTVNTDDPVFFKSDLLNEYWICHSQLNFTMDEIKQLVINSFEATYLAADEKAAWISKVEEAFKS
ncbi:MAG: adenosine deaminase [Treponema sp.]|nr:adenosine deaminase [Treponema sp.]